jgi:hypothetical protein
MQHAFHLSTKINLCSLKDIHMGFRSMFGLTALGALAGGSLGTAFGVAAGAMGSFILEQSKYEGFDSHEAKVIGGIGGAMIGATSVAAAGALASCGIFSTEYEGFNCVQGVKAGIIHGGGTILGGLAGWGLYGALKGATIMDLGKTAIVIAMGVGATSVPASYFLAAIALPVALMTIEYINRADPELDPLLLDDYQPNRIGYSQP